MSATPAGSGPPLTPEFTLLTSPARMDTRQQLLAAARDLLVEEGLSGFSMRRVAAACDVSATAIYRHFPDKDALLAQAALEAFRTFGSYLLDGLEASTPLARFRKLGRRYFDFALEHRHDYQLIFMTDCRTLGLTKLDETSKREIGGTFQLLQDRVAECQRAGVFGPGDARSLSAYVWASVHGLASLILTGNLDLGPDDTGKLVTQQLDRIEASLTALPKKRRAAARTTAG